VTRRSAFLLACEIATTALILAGLWRFSQTNSSFVVAPFADIWTSFKNTFVFERVGRDLVPTLRRIGLSFTLCVLIGNLIGLALGSSRFLQALTNPIVAFFRAVPPIALLPPAIILIGVRDNMMIILTVLAAMWPIVLNTTDGIKEIDSTMRDTAKVLRLSRLQRFRYMTVPAAAPRAFAGMHTSLAFCVIAIIAVEYITGTSGVGYILAQAQSSFAISDMWAAVLMLGILGNVLNLLFLAIQRRALYWNPTREEDVVTGT
jgi:ABC-type nitrate/sulfonate/bicarbonate transport system permease component